MLSSSINSPEGNESSVDNDDDDYVEVNEDPPPPPPPPPGHPQHCRDTTIETYIWCDIK